MGAGFAFSIQGIDTVQPVNFKTFGRRIGKWQSSTWNCFRSIHIYLYCYLFICSNSVSLSQQCCMPDNKIILHMHEVIAPVQWSKQLVRGRQINIYLLLLFYFSSPDNHKHFLDLCKLYLSLTFLILLISPWVHWSDLEKGPQWSNFSACFSWNRI